MSDTQQATEEPVERTLFGHPIGLANLFGVELWERFSFYGMLTILGYYLYIFTDNVRRGARSNATTRRSPPGSNRTGHA